MKFQLLWRRFSFTSSNDSNMSILGWWLVQTIVLPVSATFVIARMTMAAALASNPVVGSSMKIMEGFATSSTAIVSRLRCSVDKPLTPGMPTRESLIPSSSMVSKTSLTKSCYDATTMSVERYADNRKSELYLFVYYYHFVEVSYRFSFRINLGMQA